MLTVNVTQSHIEEGTASDCSTCPVALAMNEQHGAGLWEVRCTHVDRYAQREGYCAFIGNYPLPEAAHDFIRAFDAGRPVQPFAFTLAPTLD